MKISLDFNMKCPPLITKFTTIDFDSYNIKLKDFIILVSITILQTRSLMLILKFE